jgi:hypothetical protein
VKIEIEINERMIAEHIEAIARSAFERGNYVNHTPASAAIAETVRRQVAALDWSERVRQAIERIAAQTVDAIAEEAVTKACRAAAKRIALANEAAASAAIERKEN